MNTKNQLLRFFISGHISLSEYDYKFMANLLSMIEKNDRITSNQSRLFDQLTAKYKKQLQRNNITAEKIDSLAWTCKIVPTSEDYTSAYMYIEGDKLKFRVPFHKPFIEHFIKVSASVLNLIELAFSFDKTEKVYVADFSTYNLKLAYTALHKYFKVRYCKVLNDIISQLEENNGLIYEPTLKIVNGRLYLLAANECVYEEAVKIGFDLDPNTFYKLGHLGISFDEESFTDRPDLRFALSYEYTHDLIDIDRLVDYICSITNARLVCSSTVEKNPHVSEKIQPYLLSAETLNEGPRFHIVGKSERVRSIWTPDKIIRLTNSTPIEVR